MSKYADDQMLIYHMNNQKDTFRMLIILWNEGKMHGSKLQKLGMNDRTIIKVREILLNFGLIKLTNIEGSRRLYYELTKKGKRVVEKLVDLERELLMD